MLKKVAIALGGILVVVNTVVLFFLYSTEKKTGFIDYNTVYNNCKLKVSLEKDLERLTTKRKSELDSLQLQVSFLSQEVSGANSSSEKLAEFENQKNRFLTLQQQYEQENMRLKETYFTQIRKDINDKTQAFAASKGYDYFFAAVGDGALMYGSESEDVTKEFQEYLDKN